VDAGEKVIVGVNRFVEADEEAIELHSLDPEAEQRQVQRTQRVRAERDAAAAEGALTRLREAARDAENLLPAMREALAAMCTVGEICAALRDEFGAYDAHLAP
jgi:methylmalonyl-CoA mutase N-terminal domain/subunit